VLAVRGLEEAGGAEIVVLAQAVDISPEFTRGRRDVGFAGEILAAFDDRRSEAEVETE